MHDPNDVAWTLIRAAYTSVAETAIVPVQDILNLGSEARMNRPGAEHDNWSWRLASGRADDGACGGAARARRGIGQDLVRYPRLDPDRLIY